LRHNTENSGNILKEQVKAFRDIETFMDRLCGSLPIEHIGSKEKEDDEHLCIDGEDRCNCK